MRSLFLILSLALVPAAFAQPPQTSETPDPKKLAAIEGTVLNSVTGEVLRRVNLSLRPMTSGMAQMGPMSPVSPYATTTDAYHMTAPRPDAAQSSRAIREALADAHIAPHEVGYISAHASSTPLNDKTETLAIKCVFGEDAYRVPISGTKAMHGHALGATGAFEMAINCLAMKHEYLPHNVNLCNPDPECDLGYIVGEGLERRVDVILSNSFGFGGVNAALVLGRV